MLMVFMDATTKKRRTTSSWCASMMILDVQSSSYFDCFLFSFIIIILTLFQFLTIILNYCCLDLLLKEKSFKFLVIIILNLFFSIDHWIGVSILIIKELKHTIQRFHNIDISWIWKDILMKIDTCPRHWFIYLDISKFIYWVPPFLCCFLIWVFFYDCFCVTYSLPTYLQVY